MAKIEILAMDQDSSHLGEELLVCFNSSRMKNRTESTLECSMSFSTRYRLVEVRDPPRHKLGILVSIAPVFGVFCLKKSLGKDWYKQKDDTQGLFEKVVRTISMLSIPINQ